MTKKSKSTNHLHAVILAGGRGTRFWPRSRRTFPKQLMSFGDGPSLLQQTVERLEPLIPLENIWVFTNQHLAKQVARQLPGVPRNQIVAEPMQRNTAPCIGLAAEMILAKDANAVLGVFPSDHAVMQPARFLKSVQLAEKQAKEGKIVVLGIHPRWPETGYGYMEFGIIPKIDPLQALPVKQFREKPNLETAQEYLAAKRFYWNSGMFFWKAAVIRDALRAFLPETASVLAEIGARISKIKTPTPARIEKILGDHYEKCQNISIDYAVLEKARNVVGIPCEIGWNDLGSWQAVYELHPRDTNQNVLRSEGLIIESSGLYVDVPGKLVGVVGLKDLVIVDSGDALLVVHRDRAQEVSRLVAELEKSGRHHLL